MQQNSLTPDDVEWAEIAQRIQMLHNLASNPGTAGEAAAATAAVERLLFKYNLTLENALEHKGKKREKFAHTRINVGTKTDWLTEWKLYLLGTIAQVNFCRSLVYEGTQQALLIGAPHNAQVVQEFFKYFVAEIQRLCAEAFRKLCEEHPEAEDEIRKESNARKLKRSFCLGAAAEVCRRLEWEFKRNQATFKESTALVVQIDKDLQEEVDKIASKKAKTPKGPNSLEEAFMMRYGQQVGSQINLQNKKGMT